VVIFVVLHPRKVIVFIKNEGSSCSEKARLMIANSEDPTSTYEKYRSLPASEPDVGKPDSEVVIDSKNPVCDEMLLFISGGLAAVRFHFFLKIPFNQTG